MRRELLVVKLLEASILFGDLAESEKLLDEYIFSIDSPSTAVDLAAVRVRCLSRAGKTNDALQFLAETKASTNNLSPA